MLLWFAVGVLAYTLKTGTALNITSNVTIALLPEKVGFSKKVISSDATSVDETFTSSYSFHGTTLALVVGNDTQIEEGNLNAFDYILFESMSPLPKKLHEWAYWVPFSKISEQVHCDSMRAYDEIVEHGSCD
jgi:hypothetical protein